MFDIIIDTAIGTDKTLFRYTLCGTIPDIVATCCSLALTCTVSQVALASHVYLRSARTLPPKFSIPCSANGRPRLSAPDSEPPPTYSRAQLPRPRSLPDLGVVGIIYQLSFLTHPQTVALDRSRFKIQSRRYTPNEGVRGSKQASLNEHLIGPRGSQWRYRLSHSRSQCFIARLRRGV
eukprot:4874487-Pleurochrysis_carterae.AAC.2